MPLRSAASHISRAWAELNASGFSQKTCLPALAAATAISWVHVRRRCNIHNVDVGPIDYFPPVDSALLPTPFFRKLLERLLRYSADKLPHRLNIGIKKQGSFHPCIRVHAPP